MKHIIVIPYYCAREKRAFIKLALVWEKITGGDVDYEFLLSCRYDTPESRSLKKVFSRIAKTHSIRCTTKGRGIRRPAKSEKNEGPSAMFWDTMEYIREHYENDNGFVLWLEADIIPLDPSWLAALDKKWKEGRYIIMGKLVDAKWMETNCPAWKDRVPEHINGAACYSKDFCEKVPRENFDPARSWDIEIFSFVKENYPDSYKLLDFIDLRFFNRKSRVRPEPGAVLMHGIRNSSAYRFLCKKAGINYYKMLFKSW